MAKRMFAAQAFILVTPEYNGTYTAALKNLFDHFPKQSHKAFGVVTASPGAMGGMRASQQLLLLVSGIFGVACPNMLIVPGVDKKFAPDGQLTDPSYAKAVETFTREWLWLAERLQG
jgi:NAD(P)H-dependent FMN reductase